MDGDQIAYATRRLRRALAIAPGCALPVVHRARQHEPNPDRARGGDHGLGILVAAVVEIEKVNARGHAVAQHLRERERGAESDALAIEPLGEWIEHAVAPTGEVEIVTEPAQQRLERVAVRVDRAWQQRASGQRDVAGT